MSFEIAPRRASSCHSSLVGATVIDDAGLKALDDSGLVGVTSIDDAVGVGHKDVLDEHEEGGLTASS